VKSAAERAGIEAIDRRAGTLNVKFHEASRVDPQKLMQLVSSTPGAQFSPAGVLKLPIGGKESPGEMLATLRRYVEALTS
jgi:transcription-repair coupling factor (superfamily II helicase)